MDRPPTSPPPPPPRRPTIVFTNSGTASPSYRTFALPVLDPGEINARLTATSLSNDLAADREDRSRYTEETTTTITTTVKQERSKTRDRIRKVKRTFSRSSETLVKDFYDDDDEDVRENSDSTLNPEEDHNLGLSRSRSREERSRITLVGAAESKDRQYGVLKIELIAKHWGKRGFYTIYAGIYLISICTSLESNTTPTIEPYFLSMLGSHSFLSGIAIVSSIAYAVGAAPISKILDVFGRGEGVLLSAIFYLVGFALTSISSDVRIFVIARAISAFGGQGLQLAQQIIIADTTTLANRALLTSTISIPWLLTTWLGAPLGGWFQAQGERGYRSVYLTFGILTFLSAIFLVVTLALEWRRVKRKLIEVKSMTVVNVREEDVGWRDPERLARKREEWVVKSFRSSAASVWRQLDIVGLATLTFGCSLVLIPLTLSAQGIFKDPSMYFLMLLGVGCLAFFVHYEARISPLPMLPKRLLANPTIICGSLLGFFHYASQYIYTSFFTSFLQVSRGYSPTTASYISQSYLFSASVSAIIAGLLIKRLQRYRSIGIIGVVIHFAGIALMMRARRLESTNFELLASQLIAGIGGGFSTIAAQTGVQSVVSHQDVGIATAIFLTITQIGGAAGGAISGAIWSTLLPTRLRFHLPTEVDNVVIDKIMASLSYALSFEPDSPIRVAISLSYVDVQTTLNWWAFMMVFPTFVAACLMRNTYLNEEGSDEAAAAVVLGKAMSTSSESSSETSSLLDH